MADLPLDPSPNTGDLLALIPRMRLLPGEDEVGFEDLRQALLLDLAPATPYETALAENLVALEWEAGRYRRLRDDLVRERFREFAIGVFHEGKIGQAFSPSETSRRLATTLTGQDASEREVALQALAERRISEGAILARAYDKESKTLAQLDRQIAELEERRRKLRIELGSVKAARAVPVPDAEIVTDSDI